MPPPVIFSSCTLSWPTCDRNILSQLNSKKCSIQHNCVSRTPQVLGLYYIVLVCMLIWLENVHSEDRFLFNPVSILDMDTLKLPNIYFWIFRYYDRVFHLWCWRQMDQILLYISQMSVDWSPVIKICVYSSLEGEKVPLVILGKSKQHLYEIFKHFYFQKFVIWYCDTWNCQQMYVVKHSLMECFAKFITDYEKLWASVLMFSTSIPVLLVHCHICAQYSYLSLSISRIYHLSYSSKSLLSCLCWTNVDQIKFTSTVSPKSIQWLQM